MFAAVNQVPSASDTIDRGKHFPSVNITIHIQQLFSSLGSLLVSITIHAMLFFLNFQMLDTPRMPLPAAPSCNLPIIPQKPKSPIFLFPQLPGQLLNRSAEKCRYAPKFVFVKEFVIRLVVVIGIICKTIDHVGSFSLTHTESASKPSE